MKSSKSDVSWRQYGVMVKDTPETLGGMLRIERKNGSVLGDAVAFAIDQETADTIVKAVNCHDDLLEACKLVDRAFCGDGVQMSTAVDACLMAIAKATTTPQKEGAK